jgi:uncharacterized protein (TIGR02145 family)
MMKKFFKISLAMATMAIVCCSCNKDDDNDDVVSENLYNGKTTAEFNSEVSYGTMTDLDGNTYKTVTIGTQTWMAENLRTTQYNDGTAIPNVTDNDEWADLTTGAYCNYDNTTNVDTIATYGRLYNWYAVNTAMLAPTGWHVPTDEEWTTLTDYLGGESVAGDKLKATTLWDNLNTGATNETGFTALPGGERGYYGTFDKFGGTGYWWSATKFGTNYAWYRVMIYGASSVNRVYYYKMVGFSVRCLKD